MPDARGRGWWSRLVHPAGGYSRARKATIAGGLGLTVAGILIAAFAPEPAALVPEVPAAQGGALSLRYVRVLPEEGAAPLPRPIGVAVGDGRVYVTDSDDAVVRVFSAVGADAGEIGRDLLDVPAYVAYDPSAGGILVSDRGAHALLRFSTPSTEPEEVRASTEPTTPWEPLGVDVDERGRIAVTDSASRHRLLVLEADGSTALEIGGAPTVGTPGSVKVALDYPNSVLFAGEELWVADSNNRRVLVFTPEGELEQVVRIDGVARGLAYIPGEKGADAYVAVTDVLGSQIVLLDMAGAEAGRFGGPGIGEGELAYPNDVAYDETSGLLYVADTGNARVQVWEVLPGEEAGGAGGGLAEEVSQLSAMRLAGLLLALLGLVVTGATVWPRRDTSEGPRPEK